MYTISVIIPIYRGNKYIERLLDNLIRCYNNTKKEIRMEVIFVYDDPQEKRIIVQNKYHSLPIKIITLSNSEKRGIHYTRINGLRNASGDYVLFLDQDDSIAEQYFESQLSKIGNAAVVICNGIYRGDREIIWNSEEAKRIEDSENYFDTLTGIISPGQALIRKSSIPEEWMNNILVGNYCDDALLWLLLKDKGEKIIVNKEKLYFHNEDGNNTSFQWKKTANALEEMLATVCDNGLLSDKHLRSLEKCVCEKVNKHRKYDELEQKLDYIVRHTAQFKSLIEKKQPYRIAVYGYGIYGKKILKYLEECGIEVSYVIDQNAQAFEVAGLELKRLEDKLEPVDLIIITPVFDEENIKAKLGSKSSARLLTVNELQELIMEEP